MYTIPDSLKDINLREAGSFTWMDRANMPEEKAIELEDKGYEFQDDGICDIWYPNIEKHDVPYDAVLWDSTWWEDDILDDTMRQLIKPAEHYLVYAAGCRWNGADAYSIKETAAECLSRDYDSTIIPIVVSKRGKTLVCRESSHDVPMGSLTYIIALTDDEYRRLDNAEFAAVRRFAESHAGRLI